MKKKFFSRKVQKRGLTLDEEGFFLNGWTPSGKYPFKSETYRRELWKKHRERLMASMYEERNTREDAYQFIEPQGISLRPREWFRTEAPKLKRILNDAVRIGDSDHLFDKHPCLESDREFLERVSLLTEDDLKYIESEDFKKGEFEFLRYRNSLMSGTLCGPPLAKKLFFDSSFESLNEIFWCRVFKV